MRSGSVSKRPTLGRLTAATDGSASPGEGTPWQTPAAFLGKYRRQVGQESREEKLLPAQAEDTKWPTPRAISGGAESAESAERKKALGRTEAGGGDLQAAAQNWPTPNVPNGGRISADSVGPTGMTPDGRKRQVSIETAVANWPTPKARDYRDGAGESAAGRESPDPNCVAERFPSGPLDLTRWADGPSCFLADPIWLPQSPTSPETSGRGVSSLQRNWPTPYGMCGSGEGQKYGSGGEFAKAIISWPTPAATDSMGARNLTCKRPEGTKHHNGITLTDTIQPTKEQSSATKARLNPRFVEWLMGAPIGWTDFGPVEMGSWRRRALSLCASYSTGLGLSFPYEMEADVAIKHHPDPAVQAVIDSTRGHVVFDPLYMLPEKTAAAAYETLRATLGWAKRTSGRDIPQHLIDFMCWVRDHFGPDEARAAAMEKHRGKDSAMVGPDEMVIRTKSWVEDDATPGTDGHVGLGDALGKLGIDRTKKPLLVEDQGDCKRAVYGLEVIAGALGQSEIRIVHR